MPIQLTPTERFLLKMLTDALRPLKHFNEQSYRDEAAGIAHDIELAIRLLEDRQ